MTTTPAMPELPEPELGYIETDKSNQPAFSARQMRAAMQAQPAEVSDAEIDAAWVKNGGGLNSNNYRAFARAILALRPQAVPMTEAARDVLAERHRQISAEGWTPEHDDEHGDGSMATAAAAYAIASLENNYSLASASELFSWTGWAKAWWKPSSPRRDLIKAGALILAEIERLNRASGITAQAKDGGA